MSTNCDVTDSDSQRVGAGALMTDGGVIAGKMKTRILQKSAECLLMKVEEKEDILVKMMRGENCLNRPNFSQFTMQKLTTLPILGHLRQYVFIKD